MTTTVEAAGASASTEILLSKRQRRILTPEGVALTVELADRGSRAAAFLLDVVIIIVTIVVGTLALVFLAGWLKVWALVIGLLGFFLLRVFYFLYAELRGRGATPGKRIIGLKVIDRLGGPLRPEAVVVRNLMREVEVFLPLTVLMMPTVTGFDSLIQLLIVGWVGIFALMPVFNRDGLRVGDLVAGTLVIAAPKATLLPDLAGRAAMTSVRRARAAAVREQIGTKLGKAGPWETTSAAARYTFTAAQLSVYGIYELQTLESVLRRTEPGSLAGKIEIARRIRAKIGWPDPSSPDAQADLGALDAAAFLDAFYAAQRAHLERRMLFGHRRKDKHDKG